jgi:hypothetical protein
LPTFPTSPPFVTANRAGAWNRRRGKCNRPVRVPFKESGSEHSRKRTEVNSNLALRRGPLHLTSMWWCAFKLCLSLTAQFGSGYSDSMSDSHSSVEACQRKRSATRCQYTSQKPPLSCMR